RYMTIGTAKPTEEDRQQVPHHMIDVADPDETFSAARYAVEASGVVDSLLEKGGTVFVTGGTGLYIEALLGGLIETPPADPELRRYYRDLADLYGTGHLYEMLQKNDPASAAAIHHHDIVRIIRALEVLKHTGASAAGRRQKHAFSEKRYECLKIGIILERRDLFQRINERADAMVHGGLVEETERLLGRGYDPSCPSLTAFSYRHIIEYLKGKLDKDEAVRRLKRDTRNYAKRQITWFKRDRDIVWHETGEREAAVEKISRFLFRHSRSTRSTVNDSSAHEKAD
ncbi:MAG TPA: tRNA (adenosine(37)-N6)-dimethylallyltransferase MiaA, partial [Deltaproteobacteria bacterium]|nr:tRNA (adenosine(37)-N6)-dimethylallyltransferase MiaA [Deltaproteobacteria bacterium]